MHPQSDVHPGDVNEGGGQGRLEDQGKVHEVVGHPLLDDGVSPGLADDQICPLGDDNGDKIRGMTRVFQSLTVVVGPFLTK